MSYVSTLEITTVSRCSLACTYCPQDKLKAAYRGERTLKMSTFIMCVERVPLDVRIHFSGMVEPWLNARCTDMLAFALERGHRVAVYTTLQGMADASLVATMLRRRETQVDVVCIHLPDDSGNMRGHKLTDEWVSAVGAFRELQPVLGNRLEWMSMGQPVIRPHRLNAWEPNDRAGSLTKGVVSIGVTPHRGPIACSYTDTYQHNVMLPNGDVVLCCQDYSLAHPLGNLLTQSYEEILNGPEMQRIRAENAKQDGDTICRQCNGARAA